MSSAIPPHFIDLYSATNRRGNVDVMGVVTDNMAISKTRGTDWTCSFSLADDSHGTVGQMGEEGLKVRLFRTIPSDLPTIQGTGDVVMLRNIRIKEWNGMVLAMSTYDTNWTVIPAASIPETAPSSQAIQLQHTKMTKAPPLSKSEMLYAIKLCNSHDRGRYTSSAAEPTTSSSSVPTKFTPTQARRDKFSLIRDLQIETFYDLVGQVIKLYPNNDRVELYLTDYTSNNLLWNYDPEPGDGSREGDDYGYLPRSNESKRWPGPWGKQSLTVTLWSPHSYFAESNVKVDEFVHLRNVHVKWSKDAKMEGVLHSDRRYPDRVDVTVLRDHEDDDRVKDVLRRKRDYWKRHGKQGSGIVQDEKKGMKRKDPGDDKPLSKTQARKKRRQEREQKVKSNNAATLKQDEQKSVDENATSRTRRPDLNPNIRCSNHTIPPRPLSSIRSLDYHANTTPVGSEYTLPFQNINSRATVRIVDFFPLSLADFAVPLPNKGEYDVLSEVSDDAGSESDGNQMDLPGSGNKSGMKWEWRFSLTLEDALEHKPKDAGRERLKVYVAGADAEYLLKLDAEDLQKNPEAVGALREKLFLLWGDLEERKEAEGKLLEGENGSNSGGQEQERELEVEEAQGLPFQCCLKEYGVKVRAQRDGEGGGDGNKDEENKGRGDGSGEGDEDAEDWRWERRWRLWGCTIV